MDRITLVITGTVMLAACIAALLPCGVLASVGSRSPVILAQQDAAVDAADAADKENGPKMQSEPQADSKTTPAEADTLREFTPSEEIEADQGVDFPYDI